MGHPSKPGPNGVTKTDLGAPSVGSLEDSSLVWVTVGRIDVGTGVGRDEFW